MKRERDFKAEAEEVVDDVVHVEMVGATLVAQAMRELIQAQPGFDVERDATRPLPCLQVVLILGQEGAAIFRRRRLRAVRRRCPERFALMTDGQGIDFCMARDLPIRVFIGTDDSIPLFLQGLKAAAAGVNFCSPQIVPFLLAATSAPKKDRSPLGAPPPPIAAPLRHIVGDHHTKYSVSQAAESTENKGGASEEIWRAKQRGLSDREAGIALQAAQGMSNQQIADANNVTLSTVKFHLYRVYQKLGIERRSQLSTVTILSENETLV